jgi:translocation and assembly module TamB
MIKRRIIFYSIFILILGFLWLILTTSGLRFSLILTNLFIPGKINVQKIHGALVREIYFTNLNYQCNKNNIFVHRAQIRLHPLQLLTGKLAIKSLQARQIIFQHNHKSLAQLDQLQLKGEFKSSHIKIQQLAFSNQFYVGYLSGTAHLTKNYQTNLHGYVTALLPNNQKTKFVIKINGNLTQQILLQIDAQHAANLHLTASLTNFLNQGSIDIHGHWNNLLLPIDAENNLSSKLGLLSITGTLAKYKINAHINLSGSKIPTSLWNISGTGNANEFNLDKINLDTLEGKIKAKLHLAWQPNLIWQLNLQANNINPAIKGPGWQGNVNGDLIYRGNITDDQRNFTLAINNLHGSWRRQTLYGHVKIIVANDNISVEQSYLQAGNNSITLNGNLNHTWQGYLAINAPNLAHLVPFTGGSLLTNLQISGAKNMPQIKGKLTANKLKLIGLRIKHLIAAINIKLTPEGITNLQISGQNLNYHLLHYQTFNLNLRGHANDHTLQANINTQTGNYKLKLIGNYADQVWHATLQQLDLQATDLGAWHLRNAVPITIAPNELSIDPFCLQTSTIGKICGEIKSKNQRLTGKIDINFPYLAALTTLAPQQISNIRGNFTLNAKIAGTFNQPLLIGTAKIINGTLQIKPLGITLRAINLAAISKRNGEITFKGSAISGHGKINLNGTSTFYQKFSPTEINVYGRNILLVNNQDYNIVASPQLNLGYYYPQFTVEGRIGITHALITLEDFTSVATLPDNTVIINHLNETKQRPYKYYLNVAVDFGRNVKINTLSIIAQLTGTLTVKHLPLQPITADGKLSIINGNYNMRGQLLKIDRGDLIFINGPIDNPRLDIRASKTITAFAQPSPAVQITPGHPFEPMISGQRLVVGIEASGTLKHPKVKLFSEPPGLSDTNILSYLLLGTPAHQATKNQTQMLYQTAQLMGVGGANAASGIQNVFGLTDFGVEQQEIPATGEQAATTQPAFGVGKYITPRLYMHYSVGISNPISILNLTYYISRLFMLQTETSSVDQGVDVFYTFESN